MTRDEAVRELIDLRAGCDIEDPCMLAAVEALSMAITALVEHPGREAKIEQDLFRNKLMQFLADLQLTYSPNWGANGQGDQKLYEFTTSLIEEIESWGKMKKRTKLDEAIAMTAYVMDSLMSLRNIQKTGCCNECRNRKCGYAPKPGQMVRYNCPFFSKQEEKR